MTQLYHRLCTAESLRIQQDESKAAFIPLYCAIVRPQLEFAMEATSATLRADINQQKVERLATRLMDGFHHVPYEERLRQLNLFSLERRRLQADLTLACKICKGEVDLSPSDFFLRPPRAGLRGQTHRLPLAPLVMSPSGFIFKKNSWTVNGPKSSLQHLCNFCSPSPIFFSIFIVTPDYPDPQIVYFMLYIWSLLALVANPTID